MGEDSNTGYTVADLLAKVSEQAEQIARLKEENMALMKRRNKAYAELDYERQQVAELKAALTGMVEQHEWSSRPPNKSYLKAKALLSPPITTEK